MQAMLRNVPYDEKRSQILTYLEHNPEIQKVMVDYSLNPAVYKKEKHTHEDIYNKLIDDLIEAMDEENYPCEMAVTKLVERIESSQRCYDELIDAGFAKPGQKWEYKRAGIMTGCVLYAANEVGRLLKTYIKSYSDCGERGLHAERLTTHILSDYTIFTVARRCGVKAPIVKIKECNDKIYLFSDDIANYNERHPDKKYQFFELSKSQVRQHADASSIYCFLIICWIFHLDDLHEGNLGYVISQCDEKTKAKIGLIDFSFDHPLVLKNLDILNIYNDSIDGLKSLFSDEDLLQDVTLPDFVNEFQKALKKFNANFLLACDDAITITDGLNAVTRYEIEKFWDNFEIWVSNYEVLMNVVNNVILRDNLESSLGIKKI